MNARTVIALAAGLAATATAHAARAELKVVATTPDLGAIAQAVGGPDVEVTVLAVETQDPHYVDARPNLMLPLSRADLLVVNGLQLEVGWLPPLQRNARNSDIQEGSRGYFDASTVIAKLDVQTADRAKGDIHPGGNPHFTHDPRAAKTIAHALGHRMAALDPRHAPEFLKRATAFGKRLDALARREAERFRKLPDSHRRIVSYHKSLSYLLDWLGLDEVATVEPKPGIKPNPGHVAKVLQLMKSRGVKVVAQEEFYPQNTSKTLARLAGGEVVVLPGGARFRKGEGYIERVERMTEELHAALAK